MRPAQRGKSGERQRELSRRGGVESKEGVNVVLRPVTASNPDLFDGKRDPHNPCVGQVVGHGLPCYHSAAVVLVGCPQDEGGRRNEGCGGADRAPAEMRRAFCARPSPATDADRRICDLGDVTVRPTLEDTHRVQYRMACQALADGKRVVVLGGGNIDHRTSRLAARAIARLLRTMLHRS